MSESHSVSEAESEEPTKKDPGRKIPKVDLDELARLEEQRDHLLASLRDLEAEHDVGDMDDVDYAALKDDYTVRAADVLRAIEAGTSTLEKSRRPKLSRGRTAAVFVGVVAFAALAGFAVAKAAGQRGDKAITGASGSLREQLATCQTLSFQKPDKGVDCYAKILVDAPENLEALTYQGWAKVRLDELNAAEKNFDRVAEIDPTYPDVRVFRAVLSTRRGDFEAAAKEISLFYANNPSQMSVQVLQSQGLEQKIFFGLLSPGATACWKGAAASNNGKSDGSTEFYGDLGKCLEAALAAAPDDPDVLISRAFTLVGVDKPDPSRAMELLSRAIEIDPANANALLMRASLRADATDLAGARSDLAALKGLQRPTISFLVGGGPEDLSAALDMATSPSVSTSIPTSAPDRPQIPNRSGG